MKLLFSIILLVSVSSFLFFSWSDERKVLTPIAASLEEAMIKVTSKARNFWESSEEASLDREPRPAKGEEVKTSDASSEEKVRKKERELLRSLREL